MARSPMTRARRSGIRGRAVAAIAGTLALVGSVASAATYGGWEPAVNVESLPGTHGAFNTPYTDGCPIQSPDGLRFAMASNRPGGLGGLDIWVAERPSTSSPWGEPRNLGAPVNSVADDFCPTPLHGGRLFFVSSRSGGCGGPDIYLTRRSPVHGWIEPVNLGCDVNSPAGEAGPSYVEADGASALYFSSTRAGGFAADTGTPDADVYVSVQQADGTFAPPTLVPGVNSASDDARPNVRKDGLELVFDSTRPGSLGGADIYGSTRASATAAWGDPVNLGVAVNSAANETRASLSWDGRTLVFGSNRPASELAPDGITPSNDIYLSTRERA